VVNRLSVCDVGVPYRNQIILNFVENNDKNIHPGTSLPDSKEAPTCSKGIIPTFQVEYDDDDNE